MLGVDEDNGGGFVADDVGVLFGLVVCFCVAGGLVGLVVLLSAASPPAERSASAKKDERRSERFSESCDSPMAKQRDSY